MVDGGPGREHGAPQVHVEHGIELLLSRERLPLAGEDVGAGIVDPGVDGVDALVELRRERFDGTGLGEVELEEIGVPSARRLKWPPPFPRLPAGFACK